MAYGLTKSLDLEATSSQGATISDASQTGLDFTGNFTLEAWVNVESAPSDAQYEIISKQNPDSGTGNGYRYHYRDVGGTKSIRFITSSDGIGGSALSVNYTLTPGTWYHTACVLTSTTGEIFVDGTSIGTGTLQVPANDNAAFCIGQNAANNRYFDGKISLARAWNTNRSQAEISTNMCNVYGTATTNMQGEWSLNDVYTDASGNGNTLTPQNSPVFVLDVPSICAPVGALRDARSLSLLGVG